MPAAALPFLAALLACQAQETVEQTHARMQAESDSVRAVLASRNVALAGAFNARDLDALTAFYTPDAVVMPPDVPAAEGLDEIRARFEADFAITPPDASIAFEARHVTANGPVAVERGVWTITMPAPDGGVTELHGKYLVEWHNVGGAWRIFSHIWNNDAPLSPM